VTIRELLSTPGLLSGVTVKAPPEFRAQYPRSELPELVLRSCWSTGRGRVGVWLMAPGGRAWQLAKKRSERAWMLHDIDALAVLEWEVIEL
jgi:hypothetical protein